MTVGEQMCFYTDDEAIACGKVIKLKGKKAYVRLKNTQGLGKFTAETRYEVVAQQVSGGMGWLKAHLLFLPSYRFLSPEFDKQMDGNKSNEFDMKVGKFSFIGGGLELEANVSDRISVATGGRYLYLPGILTYGKEEQHHQVDGAAYGSDIGFWLDSLFAIDAYKLGAGIDFALYKVATEFSATYNSSGKIESSEHEIELKWHTLSARLAAYRYFQLDKFGFRVGAVARFPVYDSDRKTHTVQSLINGKEQSLEGEEEEDDDDKYPLFATTIMLSLSVYLSL